MSKAGCSCVRSLLMVASLLSAVAAASAQTLAGGTNHSVILKSDGTVWTMGHNGVGQLGDGTNTARNSPVQVSGLTGIVAIASGANHAMALTSAGNLYLWGYNSNGQIGDATTTNRTTAVQSSLSNVIAIAAGAAHSVALTSNGAIDPFWWTSSERRIRCPECDQVMGAGESGDSSLRSSKKARSGWSWTRARPLAPWRASWI